MDRKKIIIAGIAGLMMGYWISEMRLKRTVQTLVQKYYEQEARKFYVDIHVTKDFEPITVPSLFSPREQFVPSSSLSSPLAMKAGFHYELDDLVYDKENPDDPDLGLFYNKWGTRYEFKIDKFLGVPREMLSVQYYNGRKLPDSYVTIYDENHDGVPDSLYLQDEVNHTTINLYRNKKGNLEYDNIGEPGARTLFDLFSLEYQRFYQENSIGQRVRAYEPRLTLRQTKVSLP